MANVCLNFQVSHVSNITRDDCPVTQTLHQQAGISLTLVYSSTNMSKSVWTSGFWKPLVHKNMSNFWNNIFHKFADKSMFIKGCSSIRLESIKYHEGSNLHVHALSKHINKMKPTDAPAVKAYHSLNKALFPKLQHLFHTVHALNIKARPYQDYAWVNELDE